MVMTKDAPLALERVEVQPARGLAFAEPRQLAGETICGL